MSKPSEEQKTKLIDSLDAMPQDQWTAMVRWMIDRVVTDDQAMATKILWRESKRRMDRSNEYKSDVKTHKTHEDCLVEVLRDIGAKITVG